MKWTTKYKKLKKLYEDNNCIVERTIKMFLYLPLKINGDIRWLETVYIKAKLNYSSYVDEYNWELLSFVDDLASNEFIENVGEYMKSQYIILKKAGIDSTPVKQLMSEKDVAEYIEKWRYDKTMTSYRLAREILSNT